MSPAWKYNVFDRARAAWPALLLLLAHAWASFIVFPPALLLGDEPLLPGDYPTHQHRMRFYREAVAQGDRPWGCDPALNAGFVAGPVDDIGAKPMQIAAAAMPFIRIERLAVWLSFASLLFLPAGVLIASALLRLPAGARNTALLVLLFLFWTNPTMVLGFRWGMVSFSAASFLSPWALAAAIRFTNEPGYGNATLLALALAAAFALHVLAFFMLVVPLAFLVLSGSGPSRKWRSVAVLACLLAVAVNLFWFLPFCQGYLQAPSAWGDASVVGHERDLTAATLSDFRITERPARRAEFVRYVLPLVSLFFAGRIMGSHALRLLSLAVVSNLLITLAGSFLPVLRHIQPLRFATPTVALVCIPAGCFLFWLATGASRRVAIPVLTLLLLLIAASFSPIRERAAGHDERITLTVRNHVPEGFRLSAKPVEEIASTRALSAWIKTNSSPSDRILVQTRLKTDPRAFAIAWDREVMGSSYPAIDDPLHFDRERVFGRTITDVSPEQLRACVDLWGIALAVVWSPEAIRLFDMTFGPGRHIGAYAAYPIPEPKSRFLLGQGALKTSINRIELSRLAPDASRVVIRYRYHPGWRAADGSAVLRHPVSGTSAEFIELVNPPSTVTLRFDPKEAFCAPGYP